MQRGERKHGGAALCSRERGQSNHPDLTSTVGLAFVSFVHWTVVAVHSAESLEGLAAVPPNQAVNKDAATRCGPPSCSPDALGATSANAVGGNDKKQTTRVKEQCGRGGMAGARCLPGVAEGFAASTQRGGGCSG
mmetsp:Transcript_12429/g.18662  ORF Transcript_12429/g.18662 Transcript_12429/m.18662 type:complete len:135 (+) Transcript_12429:74-478(+)